MNEEFVKYLKSKGADQETLRKVSRQWIDFPPFREKFLIHLSDSESGADFELIRDLRDSSKKYKKELNSTLALLAFLKAAR